MDPKIRNLVLAVIAAIIMWLLGGFVTNHVFGIAFVFLSILLVGYTAGSFMDTPCPSESLPAHKKEE